MISVVLPPSLLRSLHLTAMTAATRDRDRGRGGNAAVGFGGSVVIFLFGSQRSCDSSDTRVWGRDGRGRDGRGGREGVRRTWTNGLQYYSCLFFGRSQEF